MGQVLSRRPRVWAMVLGAVAALGQAPISQPVFTVFGLLAFLFLHLRASGTMAAFTTGWAFGTGYFAASLVWIVEPFLVDPARHGWMAPFALIFLAGGLALFWASAAALTRSVAQSGRASILAWVICLSAAELARSYVLSGFPWALIGHVWIGWGPMQSAAWMGAQGLTFLTLALVAGIFSVIRGWNIANIATIAVVLALLLTPSMLATKPDVTATTQIIRVIQPNAPQHLKWHPDHVLTFFDRSLDLTSRDASTRPDLIIWPETSVPALLHNAAPALEQISAAAGQTPVVFGIQRREKARIFNSVVSMSAEGEVLAFYDKHHLVPFGEYIPGGNLAARLGIAAFAAQEGFGYSSGTGAELLNLGELGHALPLICYEAVFAQDVNAAPERPEFLLQVTNDAWFGRWIGPYQHLAQARLRAVEQGLPLVRAANTGVSGVIDANGDLIATTPLNEAGFLDLSLPGAKPATFYTRTGDWPYTGFYLLAIFTLIWRRIQNPIDADLNQD